MGKKIVSFIIEKLLVQMTRPLPIRSSLIGC